MRASRVERRARAGAGRSPVDLGPRTGAPPHAPTDTETSRRSSICSYTDSSDASSRYQARSHSSRSGASTGMPRMSRTSPSPSRSVVWLLTPVSFTEAWPMMWTSSVTTRRSPVRRAPDGPEVAVPGAARQAARHRCSNVSGWEPIRYTPSWIGTSSPLRSAVVRARPTTRSRSSSRTVISPWRSRAIASSSLGNGAMVISSSTSGRGEVGVRTVPGPSAAPTPRPPPPVA